MKAAYDIAITGSGFGGSLLAMAARRTGRSVVLLERDKHPRFAIGESTTPLSNLLLEEIAARYDLPRLTPLTKWGTWQKTYPNMACGLKRGFSFYHHGLGDPAMKIVTRENQLLVAASPGDATSDTHWYRAELDQFLVQEARSEGVDYFDQVTLGGMTEAPTGVELRGTRRGKPVAIRARFLVDATGPRGFIHHSLGLAEASFPDYPQTEALYSHFAEVDRLVGDGDQEVPPYPPDDAALHHVFDGGWIWILRFNNGVTSAGVAASKTVADRFRFADGEPSWNRLLDSLPAVSRQFSGAKPRLPFVHTRKLPFLSGEIARTRWALLPSSAGFVDPLLSTGFPLTLWGVLRLSQIIEQEWGTPRFNEHLECYAAQTRRELLAAARLIGALYSAMGNFPLFADLSMLYFVAASFSEAARRSNKSHLADSFLLCDDPVFGAACERLCRQASGIQSPASAALSTEIIRAIKPFNIAGFGDPAMRNWYPANT